MHSCIYCCFLGCMQDASSLGNCVGSVSFTWNSFTSIFINTLPHHQKCLHASLFNVHETPTETDLMKLWATPTVPHPKLSLLFSFAKTEKTFSNSSSSQVVIYPKLGKTDSRAWSATHPPVLEEEEEYKNNFFLRIPDLSFQEVER
jgi:hypothetical protein